MNQFSQKSTPRVVNDRKCKWWFFKSRNMNEFSSNQGGEDEIRTPEWEN